MLNHSFKEINKQMKNCILSVTKRERPNIEQNKITKISQIVTRNIKANKTGTWML